MKNAINQGKCWCGYKIRGENHEQGEHHKRIVSTGHKKVSKGLRRAGTSKAK